MVDYYEKLFKEDVSLLQDFSVLDSFTWNSLSPDQNSLLMATPSHDEIQEAAFGLDPASSSGPDCLRGFFYQKC